MPRDADKYGSGAFGAARLKDGAPHPHYGLDIRTFPGQVILAPAPCKPVRPVVPYADGVDAEVLRGFLLQIRDELQLKILYMDPVRSLVEQMIPKGTVIGHAQSLQKRYPGITDHIHVEVWLHGERVAPAPYILGAVA